MSARGVCRHVEGDQLGFHCPGCDGIHVVGYGPGAPWTFDGNWDAPTLSPSVFVRVGHYVPGAPLRPDGLCDWCEANKAEPYSAPLCAVCHSYVRAGRIEFLTDCTHALAGQSVALLPC